MLKIRRTLGRLIFNMGIAIPGKTVFLIETAPRLLHPLRQSHIVYQGWYLPGWWIADGNKFRAVNPCTPKAKKCKYGEFLAFPDPSSYRWISYTSGDPLAECALPLSQLPDGTPLYTVRYLFDSISGFYNPLTKSTHFVYWGVISPTAIAILCGTDA